MKIANKPPPPQSPSTTSQDNPITPTTIQNFLLPLTSADFMMDKLESWVTITFEERHAQLSEPLEPVVRHAPLSEPQNKPTYTIYPPLQQDLNRVRHINQNQKTLKINRQILHPRRNRNFQTPRVHFNISQTPASNTSDLSSSTLQETPPLTSQQTTSIIPPDYLGSAPTS